MQLFSLAPERDRRLSPEPAPPLCHPGAILALPVSPFSGLKAQELLACYSASCSCVLRRVALQFVLKAFLHAHMDVLPPCSMRDEEEAQVGKGVPRRLWLHLRTKCND